MPIYDASPTQLFAYYKECGAEIDGLVKRAGYGPEDTSRAYTPFGGGLLRSIKRACDRLYINPSAKLIDKTVELPDELDSDIGARVLTTILNTSLERTELPGNVNFRGGHPMVSQAPSCKDADGHFTPAIQNLTGIGYPLGGYHAKGSIIVHDDGHPLFLVKNHSEHTAMSLNPFTNSGVEYAPGMLCAVGFKDNLYGRPRDEILPVSVERVTGVVPTRMLAYAFPLDQRSEVCDPDANVEGEWPEMPTSIATIEDIANAAAAKIS